MRIALTPPAVDEAMPPSAIARTTAAGAINPQSVTNNGDWLTANPVPVWADTVVNTRPCGTGR